MTLIFHVKTDVFVRRKHKLCSGCCQSVQIFNAADVKSQPKQPKIFILSLFEIAQLFKKVLPSTVANMKPGYVKDNSYL